MDDYGHIMTVNVKNIGHLSLIMDHSAQTPTQGGRESLFLLRWEYAAFSHFLLIMAIIDKPVGSGS